LDFVSKSYFNAFLLLQAAVRDGRRPADDGGAAVSGIRHSKVVFSLHAQKEEE
jgi:hypothetical protein